MDITIIEFIRLVSIFSVLVPLIAYLIKLRKLPRENHIIGVLIILSAITELIVTIMANANQSTPFVYNLYFVLLFGILCSYFYEVVFKFKNRGYFYFGMGVYVLSLFIITTQIPLDSYQGEMWAITGVILVLFGIVYNNYQVEKPPLFDKNLYSGLIFNGAIMLYFSFNFFLFIIANYLLTELTPDTSRMTWAFHNVNNIIKNIAFAVGMYYTGKRRVNLTDEEVERIDWRHFVDR